MSSILYFDLKHAVATHDKIIEISGGRLGIHDLGLLESVLGHVRNDNYYLNLSDKLTHIVFSIAMNHAFIDGNKRSSIALGGFFLEINGYGNRVGAFIVEMENIVLWVAQRKIGKKFLSEIINSLLTQGELKEEIKLTLFEILK
ncbi:type II toxin-antitoxin system death-on-curing family toxin [Candidatus Microgenomates bacterium]|nr:MAG: type II toxin-antitoxin system death-on-curing family toxin [Candidatus Microgenomates bacterium]